MNLILLSGNGFSNKEWIEKVERGLGSLFQKTVIQNYRHWETGEKLIDLDFETSKLAENTRSLGNYIVFAKSAGVVLTLKSVFEGKIKPAKCIFVGLPLRWAEEYNFNLNCWIESFSVPTLFVQQTNDPMFSFNELQDYLGRKNAKDYQLAEVIGESHHYPNVEQLKQLVEEFIEQQ